MANDNRNQYNQDWDQNRNRFDQDNNYNQNNDYSQNRNRRSGYESGSNYGGASYGNQYGGQNAWNRNQDYNSGMGNYGNEYGSNMGSAGGWGSNREEYDRPWGNTGSSYGGSYNSRNMGGNYGNRSRNRGDNRDWWERTKDEVSSWFDGNDNDRNRGDRRIGGEHRGKGPKGYTRSDDRIREDVHDRLADDPYVDASDIEVKVENCEVVLTGNVSDRDQKRRAEDVVEAISGVRHVENRIRVSQQHSNSANSSQRRGDYTGNTGNVSGIGNESGTTNEIIRNAGNMNANR